MNVKRPQNQFKNANTPHQIKQTQSYAQKQPKDQQSTVGNTNNQIKGEKQLINKQKMQEINQYSSPQIKTVSNKNSIKVSKNDQVQSTFQLQPAQSS